MHGKARVLGPSVLGVMLAGASIACAASACRTDTEAEGGEDASTLEGGPRRDGAAAEGGAVLEDGAATKETFCERMRAYTLECNAALECGEADFDRWCDANTTSVDSDAYRRGYLQCATKDRCSTAERRDCMYRSYATASQSVAQQALVQAFCQTCEPGATAACAQRVVTYDPLKDVEVTFLAAWELSDAVVDQVRENCTGAGVDAGADPTACLAAFDQCAGGYYVDALVSCP